MKAERRQVGGGRPASKCNRGPGEHLLGDPPHEPQGWYSVFDTDETTLRLIRQTNEHLSARNDE